MHEFCGSRRTRTVAICGSWSLVLIDIEEGGRITAGEGRVRFVIVKVGLSNFADIEEGGRI